MTDTLIKDLNDRAVDMLDDGDATPVSSILQAAAARIERQRYELTMHRTATACYVIGLVCSVLWSVLR